MKDDMDIEKLLKQYRSDPGPGVKQSVMNRFRKIHGGGKPITGGGRLWKRPVPLYYLAASVLIAIGLSFAAGRITSAPHSPREAVTDTYLAPSELGLQDIQWQVAPNDLL